MALELRQQLKLTQQLVMTPQLQMAIKLLQLSRLELLDTITQELEENPTLEEVIETDDAEQLKKQSETASDDTTSIKEISIEEKIPDDVDWTNYLDEYSSRGRASSEIERKETPNFEAFIAKKESLSDHLLWQLLMSFPTEEEEKIGSLVIGNLNSDGYLTVSIDELVVMSGFPSETVEQLLCKMQKFDPIGVCARDPRECLLIQAKHYNLDDTLVTDIIRNHLKHLENKNYNAIVTSLKVSIKDIVAAVNVIKGLEPKPGRQFSDEEPQYIIPDIFVYKIDDEFVIALNDEGIPKLHVSPFYKNVVNNGDKNSGQAKDFIQNKMRSAAWLIRSIHQRQKTIYKVMESILRFQQDFMEKGVAHLKPMVLRDVALDLGMHESTISRVTTNKYVFTSRGIFELKYFFNSSINRLSGGAIASVSVQEKIKTIIKNENPKKPYSDDMISKILEKSNINIARRTVAKYRKMLKVLSSSKRKQF